MLPREFGNGARVATCLVSGSTRIAQLRPRAPWQGTQARSDPGRRTPGRRHRAGCLRSRAAAGGVGRVRPQAGDVRRIRCHIREEVELLSEQIRTNVDGDPRHIAVGPGQAGDETVLDGAQGRDKDRDRTVDSRQPPSPGDRVRRDEIRRGATDLLQHLRPGPLLHVAPTDEEVCPSTSPNSRSSRTRMAHAELHDQAGPMSRIRFWPVLRLRRHPASPSSPRSLPAKKRRLI